MRAPFLAILLLAVSGCGLKPDVANPALWEVSGPAGRKAWLFGTVHALERPVLWKSKAVGTALDQADTVVVEVANLSDEQATARIFAGLSESPGQPPLDQRISPELVGALKALLRKAGKQADDFSSVETWGAALLLARAGASPDAARNGVDRAVIRAAGDRQLIELEGASGQLAVFDALPEQEQRDLLEAVVRDAGALDSHSNDLAKAWRKGDMDAIAEETEQGLLADPELRAALFSQRNQAWVIRLTDLMAGGAVPFVAVGAAHLAGPEGLPQLLRARGYDVKRVQ